MPKKVKEIPLNPTKVEMRLKDEEKPPIEFHKQHHLVDKAFFSINKANHEIDFHMKLKREKELGFGTAAPGHGTSVSEARIYMIDKVVRMRGKNGRMGVDRSELLNYEVEQQQKPREDHMEWMVNWKLQKALTNKSAAFSAVNSGNINEQVSEILFQRLKLNNPGRFDDDTTF